MKNKTITVDCPYCRNYEKKRYAVMNDSEIRLIKCSKCGGTYQVNLYVQRTSTSIKEELEKVLPWEIINKIKETIAKYFNYQGKGGYENSRHIELYEKLTEQISLYENCYEITFRGKATYFQPEWRTVEFQISPNGTVYQKVYTQFEWRQGSWFHGENIEEKIENYIKHALVQWETI